MADTIIENLITKLSFKADKSQVKAFNKLVGNLSKKLISATAAITTLVGPTALGAMTLKLAQVNDELGKNAKRLDIDIQKYQELAHVFELVDGSSASLTGSLRSLRKNASEASRGVGGSVETFGMLGVSVTDANGKLKATDELLLDVSDALSGLSSEAQKAELAGKLGISEELLLTMGQGSEAIRRMMMDAKDLGFAITDDMAGAAAEFNDEFLRTTKILKSGANIISTKLMKVTVPLMKQFIAWFKINRDIIQQNTVRYWRNAVDVFKIVYNIVTRVVNVFASIVDALGGLKSTVIAVTGVLAIMNASVLLTPILLTALAASIFLLLEDLIKFAEGGDSAIGDLAKRFPVLEAFLRTILDLLGMVKDGWTLIFTQGGEALDGFLLMLKDAYKVMKSLKFKDIVSVFKWAYTKTGTPKTGDSSRPVNQNRATGLGVTNQSSSVTNNNRATTRIDNININGGNTEEVKRVLSDVLSGAQTNLESQVDV